MRNFKNNYGKFAVIMNSLVDVSFFDNFSLEGYRLEKDKRVDLDGNVIGVDFYSRDEFIVSFSFGSLQQPNRVDCNVLPDNPCNISKLENAARNFLLSPVKNSS